MNQGIEVLSPASYIQNSGWLFQETKGTKWTVEENKQFENALAVFDKDTPDRWLKVAAMIPGKTVGDVIKQYRDLEEDVSDIEAGLIPIKRHGNSCFTLEWIEEDQGYDGFKQLFNGCGKRGMSTRSSEHERKKGVPWTEDEHRLFLMGLKKYGKGDWRSISRHFVTSRTPTQVASHAQKYFLRQHNGGKDKRRSSIHDITTVHIPDDYLPSPEKAGPISPDNSSTVTKLPSQSGPTEQQHEEIPVDEVLRARKKERRSVDRRRAQALEVCTGKDGQLGACFWGLAGSRPIRHSFEERIHCDDAPGLPEPPMVVEYNKRPSIAELDVKKM
ncbi:hypothetical protein MLD38_029745 [Melastoma candidum]|uniref:Uncharacterized protein n=1 Tax=Melastoma candidum TaxID=119954 RepID=A0ACB9N527_9MYRT|nr:hypothetical protein MLD38_029745 [Melastoma candidum]